MEVYIEYVIIDNLIIDYIILYLSSVILREKPSKVLCFCGGIFGAIFSATLPLIEVSSMLITCYKIGMSVVIVFVSRLNRYKYMESLVLFYLLTFSFGGACIGVFNLFKIPFENAESLYYEMRYPVGIIVLGIFMAVMLFIKAFSIGSESRIRKQYRYIAKITSKNREITLDGYMDSGNFLVDKVTTKPIVVVSYKDIKELLTLEEYSKLVQIPYGSIGRNQGCIRLFDVDKIVLYQGNYEYESNFVIVGISPSVISTEFQILLNPMLIEGEET